MVRIRTNKTKVSRHYHLIHDIPSRHNTRSSYILLTEKLKEIDEDYIQHKEVSEGGQYHKYDRMKQRVFNEVKDYYGALLCTICLEPIKIPPKHLRILKDNHATIEHIRCVSKGGLRYSVRNMTCTCYKCNQDRGDQPLFQVGKHEYSY